MIIFLSTTPRLGRSAGHCRTWGGGGARGRGFCNLAPREAPASRPPALRPAAFNGWTRRERRRAEARRIREAPGLPLLSRPEATAPGTEKPQVERRTATRLGKRRGPPHGGRIGGRAARRSTPSHFAGVDSPAPPARRSPKGAGGREGKSAKSGAVRRAAAHRAAARLGYALADL